MYDPITDRGVDTKNQRATTPSIVPKGTAPEDSALIKKKLRAKNVPKMILLFPQKDKDGGQTHSIRKKRKKTNPVNKFVIISTYEGNKKAVPNTFNFQASPPNILYMRAEMNPATMPKNM